MQQYTFFLIPLLHGLDVCDLRMPGTIPQYLFEVPFKRPQEPYVLDICDLRVPGWCFVRLVVEAWQEALTPKP